MEVLLILILAVILVGGIYAFQVFKKLSETRIRVAVKQLGLNFYKHWVEVKTRDLESVGHKASFFGPFIHWDSKTSECLFAAQYKSKLEDDKGWEYEIVWEVVNMINGEVVDKWWYGTATSDGIAGDGNRKKTKEETDRDSSEMKRGEKVLRKFLNN